MFQHMLNYHEMDMHTAARFLECLFQIQDTDLLSQIVYTSDFKLVVEVLLRELRDVVESASGDKSVCSFLLLS